MHDAWIASLAREPTHRSLSADALRRALVSISGIMSDAQSSTWEVTIYHARAWSKRRFRPK